MVEFALAATVIFSLIFGIIQIGQALWERNTLQYAVSVAGRYAMAHASATSQELTQQVAGAAVGLSSAVLSVTTASSVSGSTNFVTITATYPFNFLTAFLPIGTVTLSAESRVPLS
jgi:Flp pilus assembly protein TadG